MKILAGGPAVDIEAEYFKASRDSIVGQKTKHELKVNYIVDESPGDFHVTDDNHHWSDDSVHRVARMRQDFMDMAEAGGYDACWFVDSDLILGPRTLETMLDVDAPIVFGVFWTTWKGQKGPLPQVWDTHSYGFDWVEHPHKPGERIFPTIEAMKRRMEIEVNGGGACTLIRMEAFGKARYFPPLKGMPWWGEDRDFCTRAQVHGLQMVATGKVQIAHLYTPEQRTPEAIAEAKRVVGITQEEA